MNAGDRIKELRILNSFTQEELGQRVGVKKAAVQKWESEIFDVSPTYVMGLSNVKKRTLP